SFTPDVAGSYVLELEVFDGVINDFDNVLIEVEVNVEELLPIQDLYARAKDSKIDIVWTHVDAASYNVYRSDAGGVYSFIANTTSTYSVYADFGLTNGVEYCYVVRSVDATNQESPDSNEACATPAARRRR
ncbi:MAG: hypothetical protein V3S49_04620, partial [Thermodesulfobacteriota bacterium]